jgi:hypothetical protein
MGGILNPGLMDAAHGPVLQPTVTP